MIMFKNYLKIALRYMRKEALLRRNLLKTVRFLVLIFLILISLNAGITGELVGKNHKKWKKYKSPEQAGFSSAKLLEAKAYWEDLRPALAAAMVIYKGKILVSWGDTRRPYMCHSIRKSFLSALYGIQVNEGHIDIQKTMADLGIDDVPPLSEAEKQAKVIHLLKSRSGIYHEAAYESEEMKAIRPPRGSHPPDTYWYYNNWDFNTLGTIFEQETDTKIFKEFKDRIASPVGMQDFRLDLCQYYYERDLSIHPAYLFQMSARDRARFGQLFLQNGCWGDEQIISEKWIKKSTKSYSDTSSLGHEWMKGIGYGLMWWTFTKDAEIFQLFDHLNDMGAGFYASGYGGHVIVILPEQETVFVQVVDTFQGLEVGEIESFSLFDKIFAARELDIFDLTVMKAWFNPREVSPGDELKLNVKVQNLSRKTSVPTEVDFYLSKDKRFSKSDIHVGCIDLPGIKYRKKKVVKLKTQILDTINPCKYYLMAYVDQDNLNLDPYPQNNIFVNQKKLKVR
jgi:CubicO group peptidase (beta-lactamase class C family)